MPNGSCNTLTPTSPLAVYQSQLGAKLDEDPSQLQAIRALDELFKQLRRQNTKPPAPIKGLYLWGDVGRGKTFLMDLFYWSSSLTTWLKNAEYCVLMSFMSLTLAMP
jgi:cell division protein ZapE